MPDRLLSNLEKKTGYALIHIYIKHLPALKLANALLALLMVFALWGDTDNVSLIIWFGVHLCVLLTEFIVSNAFLRQPLRFSSTVWVLFFVPASLISGLLWGSSVPLFMDISNPGNVIIMTTLLLGMLSGSLYSLSILRPLFHVFSAMVLLPYAVTLYAEQGFMMIVIAALGLALFLAWLSHQLFRITYDLLFSRLKNKAYADELMLAKAAVEQASAAKTRFLASASHDLRQPLQAMVFCTDTLSQRINDPKNIKILEMLKASHASMRRIMDSLLDISKLDAGIVKPEINAVNVSAIIPYLVNSFRLMAKKKNVFIRSRIMDVWVHSDAALLERMLSNLISNAVQYTQQGKILVSCRRSHGMVILDVWDTGQGIPDDQLDKVFHEFHQLNNPERNQQKGLGLGLSIVQRLARLLPEHHIALCSKLGKGSRFRLTLPIAEAPPVNGLMNKAIDQDILPLDRFHAMQVLVIEDDVMVCQALVAVLQTWACRVVGVGNMKEAISHIEQDWIPDAIIADYRLPDGETGVQVIAKIRDVLDKHIPALIVTGESLPKTLQDIQAADVMLLHKPVLPAKLKLFLRHCASKT